MAIRGIIWASIAARSIVHNAVRLDFEHVTISKVRKKGISATM
jgi:hypothetical protein